METTALLEQALSASQADETEASFTDAREASTRFANNAITQNVSKRSQSLTVRAIFGRQVGRASTNRLDAEGIRECVERAEAVARSSAPDAEFLGLPEPQQYPAVASFDPRVAEATPEDRAAGVKQALEVARARGLQAAGSFATNSYCFTSTNSHGLRFSQDITDAQFAITQMVDDGSGWARSVGYQWGNVNPLRDAEVAADKAVAARSPQDLPPGEYTVVLEPAATDDYFGVLAWTLDARAAHEGHSAFTGKEDTRIAGPGINLYTQPDHPMAPCLAHGEDGVPLPTTAWIEDGYLRTLAYSRYWAEKSGRPFTGAPRNLIMAGGDESLADLIGGVERGVLVTRFWYIRFVDPMTLLLTGMTRDGLFWIENGEVRHGLRNLRFNDSPLACLNRVTARGPQARGGWRGDSYMPAMRIDGFKFTSGTSF
jgi:predicted Zn-dependent protease